jgi:hypothetical protein
MNLLLQVFSFFISFRFNFSFFFFISFVESTINIKNSVKQPSDPENFILTSMNV